MKLYTLGRFVIALSDNFDFGWEYNDEIFLVLLAWTRIGWYKK